MGPFYVMVIIVITNSNCDFNGLLMKFKKSTDGTLQNNETNKTNKTSLTLKNDFK